MKSLSAIHQDKQQDECWHHAPSNGTKRLKLCSGILGNFILQKIHMVSLSTKVHSNSDLVTSRPLAYPFHTLLLGLIKQVGTYVSDIMIHH